MKLIGNIKIEIMRYHIGSELEMKITFKIPGKMMSSRTKCVLCTTWNQGYQGFLKESVQILSDKENLHRRAKELMIKRYKEVTNNSESDLLEKELSGLIKGINSSEFKIEIDV